MELYIIRHGQSEANVNLSVYFQKPDSLIELTDIGRQQAIECGKQLCLDKAIFYTSPYKRARDTAELIMNSVGVVSRTETMLLREQTHQGFKSKKERDIFNLQREHSKEPFFYEVGNYESRASVCDRMETFLLKIKLDKPTHPVVIIAHEVVIRALLSILDNTPYEEFSKEIKNCEIIKRTVKG